mgnify:CR=1 FL=1
MPIRMNKNANFGKCLSGKVGTIGVTIYDSLGSTHEARRTTGILELAAGTGLYSTQVVLPNHFSGSIVWDVNEKYAVDSIDTSDIFTRQMTEGRWKIDSSSKQMIFYGEDASSEIARYTLKDGSGNLSITTVLERVTGSA